MASVADVILRQRIEGADFSQLPAQLRRIPATVPIRVQARDDASGVLRGTTTALSGTERAQDRLAQSAISLARAQGNYAQAIKVVDQQLAAATGNEERTNRLLTQRIRLSDQAAAASKRAAAASSGGLGPALPRTLDGLTGSAASFAKGIVGATAGLVAFGSASEAVRGSFNLVATLDQTQRSLGVLAGSQTRANSIMADAISFGNRYRITQEQIGEAVRASGTLIRDSTVGTEKALEVLTRLTSIAPGKTFDDAARSVRELASGDYVSIADQFNVGKKAALELRDAVASGQDVFQVLDRYLTNAGASAAILGTRLEGATGAANNMAVATERFEIGLGKLATSQPVLNLINGIADGLNSAATAANAASTVDSFAARIAAGASSYDAYIAKVQEVNGQLGIWTKNIQALTPEQFAAAQALAAQGTALDDSIPKLQALSDITTLLTQAQAPLNQQIAASSGILQELGPSLLAAATYNEQYAQTVGALIVGLQGQTLTEDQVRAALDALVAAIAAAQAATEAQAAASTDAARRAGEHSLAIQDASKAIQEATEKAVLDEAQSRLSAQAKDQLAASAQAAAQELLNSGNASLAARTAMAAQYGVALNLVDAYLQIAQAARAAAIAQAGASAIAQNIYDDAGNVMAGRGSRKPPGAGGEVAARLKALREIEAAQQQAILSTGTYSQKIAALTKERDKFVKGSADWIKANTALKSLQQSAGASAAKATTKDAKDQAREAERLQAARDALLSDEEKLATLRQRVASGKLSELDRLEAMGEIKQLEEKIAKARETADTGTLAAAKKLKDAREALLSDQERLAIRKAEVASGKLPEQERLEAMKEIADLEDKIADTRQRAEEAAVNAELGRVNDAQKRMEEERRIAAANRVLDSKFSTAEEKKAAQLALEEVRLERQKRALDIQQDERTAREGGVAVPGSAAAAAASGARFTGGAPVLPSLKDGALPVVVQDAPIPASPQSLPPAAVAAVEQVAGTGGDAFAAAVRTAIDGATLMLQGSDGRLTPAILQIAASRVQTGKRG